MAINNGIFSFLQTEKCIIEATLIYDMLLSRKKHNYVKCPNTCNFQEKQQYVGLLLGPNSR